MTKDNCQKIKLLKLMELLRQETDENHPMKTSEICRRLGEMGISCERRTVGKDMKVLREQGFEIMSELSGHENSYWIADRSFELPELKILMDAVQAALFIPEDKTEKLIEKIAALGGSHQAELLKGNVVRFNSRKHTNHAIFYNVQEIEDALQQRKKVSFRYYDLDENLEKAYRMNGSRYMTEPVSLIYDDNNYYMLSYSKKYDHLVSYRVDRMDQVQAEDDPISDEAKSKIDESGTIVEEAFRMYLGETRIVTLQFHDRLMGVMYDHFGEDQQIRRVNDRTCETAAAVQLSPPFWGWLMQYPDDLELLGPEDVKAQYKEQVSRILAKLEEESK